MLPADQELSVGPSCLKGSQEDFQEGNAPLR